MSTLFIILKKKKTKQTSAPFSRISEAELCVASTKVLAHFWTCILKPTFLSGCMKIHIQFSCFYFPDVYLSLNFVNFTSTLPYCFFFFYGQIHLVTESHQLIDKTRFTFALLFFFFFSITRCHFKESQICRC